MGNRQGVGRKKEPDWKEKSWTLGKRTLAYGVLDDGSSRPSHSIGREEGTHDRKACSPTGWGVLFERQIQSGITTKHPLIPVLNDELKHRLAQVEGWYPPGSDAVLVERTATRVSFG